MKANTKKHTMGAGDKEDGRGKEKTMGKRDMSRSVEGRGVGRGTRGKHNGHDKDFQEGKQGI